MYSFTPASSADSLRWIFFRTLFLEAVKFWFELMLLMFLWELGETMSSLFISIMFRSAAADLLSMDGTTSGLPDQDA